MEATLLIHLEPASDGSPVWWVEAESLPGFTASADSLAELRAIIAETLPVMSTEDDPVVVVGERLVGAEAVPVTPAGGPAATVEGEPAVASEATPPPRQVLVPALALAA